MSLIWNGSQVVGLIIRAICVMEALLNIAMSTYVACFVGHFLFLIVFCLFSYVFFFIYYLCPCDYKNLLLGR